MTPEEQFAGFLARMTPERRAEWDAALADYDRRFPRDVRAQHVQQAARRENECCLPENCPNSAQWNGQTVSGWGGNPDAPHTCCLCAKYD